MKTTNDFNFLTKSEADEISKAQFFSMIIVAKFVGFIIMSFLAYSTKTDGYWYGAFIFFTFSVSAFLICLSNNVKFFSIFKANVDRVKHEKVVKFFNDLPLYDFTLTKQIITKIEQDRGYFIVDDFKKIKRKLESKLKYMENTPEGDVIQKLIISVEDVLGKTEVKS